MSDTYIKKKQNRFLQRKNQIILVSGNSKQKNLEWTINKLKKFISDLNWKIIIVGVNKNLFNVNNKKFKFYDYVDNQKLINLYDESKILIFPSKNESFGIPIHEALSRGLHVLANKTGATVEIGSTNIDFFSLQENNFEKKLEDLIQIKEINFRGIEFVKKINQINLNKLKKIYEI